MTLVGFFMAGELSLSIDVSVLQGLWWFKEDLAGNKQKTQESVTVLSDSSGPANFTEITKDFDENKENKTPEGSQGEVDWLQQYDMEREREEQELQQALAQSLQEQVRNKVCFPESSSPTLET